MPVQHRIRSNLININLLPATALVLISVLIKLESNTPLISFMAIRISLVDLRAFG